MTDFDCTQFACFSFSFCIYIKKGIRHNWSKLPYVDLHLDQQPEPIYLKNDGINIILTKKFL